MDFGAKFDFCQKKRGEDGIRTRDTQNQNL